MRYAYLALLCGMLAGCSSSSNMGMPGGNGGGGGTDGGGDMALPPGTTGMTLISSDYMIPTGQEFYQCQRMTVQQDMYLVKVTPVSPTGVHHEVLAIDPSGQPDGVAPCDAFGPTWQPLFASGINSPELDMPEGVALKISAGQQIVLQLHLFNATTSDIKNTASVDVALAADPTGYELASVPFIGNIKFTIGQSLQVNGTCTLSNDAKYFAVFPHMHQHGAHLKAWTEGSVSQTVWDEDYSFTEQKFGQWAPIQMKKGDKIQVTCTYDSGGLGISFGQSTTQEMCFAISYLTPPVTGSYGTAFCVQ
jgi:hypothetical protein